MEKIYTDKGELNRIAKEGIETTVADYFWYYLTSGAEPENMFDFVAQTGLLRPEDPLLGTLFLQSFLKAAK